MPEMRQVVGIDDASEIEISVKENGIVLRPTNLKDHKIMKTFLGVLQDYDETFKKLAK